MHAGRTIIDADAHVVEPGGVFGDAMPPGAWPMDLPAATPMVPCGDAGKIDDQLEHGFDAPSYLRAMDREGIDGVVLYPSLGLFVPFQPELTAQESAAACRSYNEWVASYCAVAPDRLAASGIVPLADPDIAAKVAIEAAALDLVAVLVRPNHLYGRNLGDRDFDPLYDAVEETGIVLAVHEGLGVMGPTIGDRFDTFALRHACSHPMEQMAAMASLMLGGALERHPAMRVAFLESGTGWLPYWLARLDGHREWMADSECAELSLSPSEYFRRQCVISSDPDDPLVGFTVARAGADHVMWASDFPHPDALFPDAVSSFLNEAEELGLTPPVLDAILAATPLRFYRLDGRFRSPG